MDIRELFDDLKNESVDVLAATLRHLLKGMTYEECDDMRHTMKWFAFGSWEDMCAYEDELMGAERGYTDRVKRYSLTDKENQQALLHLQYARERFQQAKVKHSQADRFYLALRKVIVSL